MHYSTAIVLMLLVAAGACWGQDVVLQVVAVGSPSGAETTVTLPTSVAGVVVGSTYYLELWTSDVGTLNTGVSSMYVDLGWPAAAATATAIGHGSIYTVFPSGTISPGFINELGGSTLSPYGIEPEWARVATVTVTADEAGSITYTPAPSSTGVAALGRSIIPWAQVLLNPVSLEHYPDCNTNGVADYLDILGGFSQDCDANGIPDECQLDSDGDGAIDACDACPADPNKTDPGVCGCGVPDTDSDGDGTPDCNDLCPNDPLKTDPGVCGCGVADDDSDGDGTPDCNDLCPNDPLKTDPGVCGCGVADDDTDGDGVADCLDGCPTDPNKT
ncbi:MAG TPA: thrombospondin type 3 repeat-containing protein, partial [Candidatus Anammoximicrobium sp.]|nr:thrombospondin type 3 repeat-containing protein [Candidatus Anammoximicrobium sp.]